MRVAPARLFVVAGLAFAASVAATLWVIAGIAGLLYFAAFLFVGLPGVPIGFALFGRHHAGGWIAGVLLGYAITSFVWWSVVFAGVASTPAFVIVWVTATVITWAVTRPMREPLVTLPVWTRRDSTALLLLLLLVPVLVGRPFSRLGSADMNGNLRYRAYFIVDFVWHTALTAELARQDPRPRNPFLASQPVHYYWTYFRVPATIAAQTGISVQDALKLNAVGTALLFLSAIYLAGWVALSSWPFAMAAAVAITVLAPSAEGLASIADILRRGGSMSELRNLNIDAIAAWAFKGLRIDDLPRAMWYTPQHSMSLAVGLLAVPVALAGGVRARLAAILIAGCALGASLMFNPLIGAVLCLVYGATVLIDMVRTKASVFDLSRHVLAVIPVLLAFAWCSFNQVGDGAVEALHFGFWGPARKATVITFLLSFGPLLIPMALGLWAGGSVPWRSIEPALVGVILSVLLMHLVTLTVDQAWVGFRGGQLFFVLAPAIVARGLVRLWQCEHRGIAVVTVAAVLLAGLPTTVIDAYNTQDVTNRGFSPRNEFHWTVVITAPEHEALEWIRTHTPPDAVVQAEPNIRGRETWSLIPTFAERRMATGNALPLLPVPEYDVKNEQVHEIYASNDAAQAWRLAKDLGIAYLYVDATERAVYPAAAKFDRTPAYFESVFRNAEADVYRVK